MADIYKIMEMQRNIGIAPDPDCIKGVVACQCELGKEKLFTAPPRRFEPIPESSARVLTAPCARDTEQYRCPVSHILITFKSPLHPDETFSKVFPSLTPVRYVKRKLSKLLAVPANNLLLTKNRTILKDTTLLSDVKTDPLGNIVIDIFTVDAEEFHLSSIPKESYLDELLDSVIPKKKAMPFVAIKFKVKNQNQSFTRCYRSILRVHEIKKNLSELFNVDEANMVLLRGENPLNDRMAIHDLDYDEYGNTELELLMKYGERLNCEKLYKEMPVNDVLTVQVPLGQTVKCINVEIFSKLMEKPYLGGYKNVKTGKIYHHAYTHTPQKKESVPSEGKTCRDTQTAEEKERMDDTCYSRATQMASERAYIPNVNDRILVPRPYETYEEMMARLNHAYWATVIQRAFRHYQFRQKVKRWLAECMERIARMKEEDRLEQEAIERRLRRDLITKTFPKTREDFDQLYAMVDRWKHAEIARISSLHAKGPKIAEFSLLLDKEVELLRCIEDYRVKVKEDDRKLKEQSFLDEISKPVAWFARDGKIVQMETIPIQKAKKLKELYNAFLRSDMETKERLELLVDLKFALNTFNHDLTDDIMSLLDQEADLVIRRCTDNQLEFLRRRIAASLFQFIKTSDLNSETTKCKDIRQYRSMHSKLYLCEMCTQVKPVSDFPLNTKMSGFIACTSCTWKDVKENRWIDMTPFKFILRAVQRDERRRKCWGSVAFVLQAKDVFFIVEKLWHSHSAISENDDITELRLCRWHVHEDWSPWNCFLITMNEMKSHLKLEFPEKVYDEELVQKVYNKHKLAKQHFEQLIAVNRQYTQDGEWQAVRAKATDRVDAVDRI